MKNLHEVKSLFLRFNLNQLTQAGFLWVYFQFLIKILIKSAKFIYGGNTKRLPHDVLFERVGFPRREDYFEVAAATWMHKIIHQNNPEMITDYIRHPKYR